MSRAPALTGALRPHRAYTPYVFLAPALAVLGVFVVWAFIQVVYLSFTRVDLFSGERLLQSTQWVGLDNYRSVLSSPRFWWCLGNSFLYLLVTPVIMLISLAAAMTVQSGLRGIGS